MTYDLQLTKEEGDLAQRIADLKGVTKEEAAALVIRRSLESRVKRQTGKSAAKVYSIGRPK